MIGFAALLALVAAALYLLVQGNVNQARVEAAASQALGMEVRIGGAVRTGFFPGLRVTIDDVTLRSNAAPIGSARQARIEIEWLALLNNEVRISKIALQHPTLSVERERDGRFNVAALQAAGRTVPDLDWPNLTLSDASLAYLDKQRGERFEAEGCDLDVHNLRLTGGKSSNRIDELSFTAQLACRQLRSEGLTVSDLRAAGDAKHGVIDLKPLTMVVFGAPGSGSIQLDLAHAVPAIRVRYALPQFPIEEFFKSMSLQKVAVGRMDFSAELSMQGTTRTAMRQTLTGQLSLRGKQLTYLGGDLDRQLARFEATQDFSLVDVGAFFFVGPLGLVVTKGLNFASVLQPSAGSSEIRTLVSDWSVERGVARAQDVALATKENRIALHGALDFTDNRFDGVTVALIDAQGCAKVRQAVRGTFQNPVVEKPGLLTSLAGPAIRLLKRGSEMLGGGRCDAFYAGSVAAPG